MTFRGVLFDFDGTLTLPGALDFPALKAKMRCPDEVQILEYLEGLPFLERCRLAAVLEQHEMEAAARSVPNHGAETCLSRLKKQGFPIGILTRNSAKSVRKAFECFRTLTPADFAAMITRDEARPKPHPEGVWMAAERMGVAARELLVVGDFRFDIMAGFHAGAKSALLSRQPEAVMRPGDPKPDYVVRKLQQIFDILESDQPLLSSGAENLHTHRNILPVMRKRESA